MQTNAKEQNEYNIFTFVKENVRIEDAAQRLGLQLEKTGSSYQGSCPTGHTSKGGKCFSIETKRQFFRCFNCQKSGDVITLVEITKHLDPLDAVEWLIKEFNLESILDKQAFRFRKLTPEQKTELELQRINGRLYEDAFNWMKQQLYESDGQAELKYLTEERKYDLETIKKSDWCFFPNSNKIREYLYILYPADAECIQNLSLHGFIGERIHLAIPYRNNDGLITGFPKRTLQHNEDNRFFPFIEQGTAAYAYYDRLKDIVHLGVGKDILSSILASKGQKLPDPVSVLTATFDVHNNKRIDLEKEIFNFFVPSEYMLLTKTSELINPRKDFNNIYRLLSNLLPCYRERKIFLNWLAGIMQTREKQLTAWVFKGEQGAGKGLLLSHVLKKLLVL